MSKLSLKTFNKILLFAAGVFFLSFFIFSYAPKAQAIDWPTVEPIYKVLSPDTSKPNCSSTAANIGAGGNTASCFTDASGNDTMGSVTVKIWGIILNIMNTLVLAALIWVAFMNILRIQIDSYAVKKILPTFIMSVVLANFSFLIARMIIDLSNVSISVFLTGSPSNGVTGAFNDILSQTPNRPVPSDNSYSGYIIVYILKQFFVIVGAVLMAILGFIFLVRNFFLYFLICVAPAAFMAMILPMTKKYFQQWWSQFWKWVFMPVISVFWLWLAGEFLAAIGANGTWVLPMAFAGICLYMAITSPFKVDKAVGSWAGLGKKVWGKTGGRVTGAAKNGFDRRYNRAKQNFTNKMMDTRLGRWYERHAAYQIFADQLPTDVRNKAKSNAERDVYQRAYSDHITGKKKLPDAAFSRVKARDRNNISENQITIRGAESEALFEQLGQLGALDRNDRLKPETKLAKFEPGKYIEIKTIVKELREQTQHNATRGTAVPIWKKLTYLGGVDERNNVRRAKYATASDIADDVLPPTPEEVTEQVGAGKDPKFKYKTTSELDAMDQSLFEYPRRRSGGPSSAIPMTGQNDQSADSSATPGQNDQPPPADGNTDFSRMEELLEQLVEQGKVSSKVSDSVAANVVKPSGETGISAGVFHMPEVSVRIKSIDPVAGEQLRTLQMRVAKANSTTSLRMAQRQELALQSVAKMLKDGQSPDEIDSLVKQGREQLAAGDTEGARKTALKINPNAEPSLNLEGEQNGQ